MSSLRKTLVESTASSVVTWVLGILGAVCLAVVLASAAITEDHLDGVLSSHLPGCPAALEGKRCPACGLSHAFVAMAHGRARQAREHHPCGVGLFVSFVVLGLVGPGLVIARLVVRSRP